LLSFEETKHSLVLVEKALLIQKVDFFGYSILRVKPSWRQSKKKNFSFGRLLKIVCRVEQETAQHPAR
jgi:hypothetical protein